MADNPLQAKYVELLKIADVSLNGRRPWDITVRNERLYKRVLKHGMLGIGEAYMEGWWQCDDLEEMIFRVLRANLYKELLKNWRFMAYAGSTYLLNRQNTKRSYKNAQSHYDIGNDLYEPMLGPTMAYSCGYWQHGAKKLDQAQLAKFELICQKLQLKKGMSVLDIGMGWGGLARYMAEKYHVTVVGLTPAREQVAFVKKTMKQLAIKPVETTYQDFVTKQKFDRIVSVGMFEHVGPKNYKKFFKRCQTWLKDDGLFLLHTIGGSVPARGGDPWIEKYIFPGGVLPSPSQITSTSEKYFTVEDLQNFGNDYHKTLLAWYKNFKKVYPKLDHQKYDKRFYRMWEFYLLSCAANFRARQIHLYQVVFSKAKLGTYVAAR